MISCYTESHNYILIPEHSSPTD